MEHMSTCSAVLTEHPSSARAPAQTRSSRGEPDCHRLLLLPAWAAPHLWSLPPTPHCRRTTPARGATPHLWNLCTSWALPRSWLRSSASCCRDRQRSLSSYQRTRGVSPHPTPGKGQNQRSGGFIRKESLGHRGLPGSDLPSSISEHTAIARVQKVRSGHSSPDPTVQTLRQHPA